MSRNMLQLTSNKISLDGVTLIMADTVNVPVGWLSRLFGGKPTAMYCITISYNDGSDKTLYYSDSKTRNDDMRRITMSLAKE